MKTKTNKTILNKMGTNNNVNPPKIAIQVHFKKSVVTNRQKSYQLLLDLPSQHGPRCVVREDFF